MTTYYVQSLEERDYLENWRDSVGNRRGKVMLSWWHGREDVPFYFQASEFVPRYQNGGWQWMAIRCLSDRMSPEQLAASVWAGFPVLEEERLSDADCVAWDKGVDDGVYS